jgi:hypothetical protein
MMERKQPIPLGMLLKTERREPFDGATIASTRRGGNTDDMATPSRSVG